ncbi:MAG: hypothetical protein V1884_03835 [Candidatus Omnitrophota bacterium]
MNIFVGNLLFEATEGDVKKLFEGFGNVASVAIVMEKKGIKSRGFGFVQMPDEEQALAAIAALNDKEFMGRPLNVNPVRPKPAVDSDKGKAKKIYSEIEARGQEYPKEEGGQKAWYKPAFNKKRGRYKTGRRSQSFMKRRAASGIVEETKPKQDSRENPMRWRKNYEQPKPWKKSRGEHTPWKKTDGESRPWKKSTEEPKPFKRKEGEFRPWRKKAVESKPRRKSGKRPRPRQSQIESRRKPGGYTR